MRNREQVSAGGWTQPVQIGALVTVVIVSVILLGLASSQGKRMSALERNVKTVRDEIGRLAEGSGHANVEVDLAELKVSVRKLRTRVSLLDRKVAAIERDRPGEGLAESVADLTKIVRELSDELAEVRRIAEKPDEPAAAAAKPDASAEDIAALSDRLAKIERGAAELEKLFRKVSDGSSKVRVNEEALKKVVRELVGDEVREAVEKMRNRRRQGGRQGGRRQRDAN